jgi:hypothetical protein
MTRQANRSVSRVVSFSLGSFDAGALAWAAGHESANLRIGRGGENESGERMKAGARKHPDKMGL